MTGDAAAAGARPPAATPGTPPAWSGAWVAQRLGVELRTTGSPVGVTLPELVGLALRRNPRRAHLLVSTVLGKHVPTDPRVVHASARLLGALVAGSIAGSHDDDATTPAWTEAADAFAPAVAGVRGVAEGPSDVAPGPSDAAEVLRERTDRLVAEVRARHGSVLAGTVVLGYAETATALGHGVAEALGARYLHSTRRAVPGVALAGGFEEQHSHATSHLLLPEDPAFLAGPGPLVLVDDELSTGQTILNTITALHARYPRGRYVVAALVDVRSDADRARLADLAEQLGVRIDAVALVAGTVALDDDVLAAGQRLVAEHSAPEPAGAADAGDRAGESRAADAPGSPAHPVATVVDLGDLGWPATVPDGARHGVTPQQLDDVADAARAAAEALARHLEAGRRAGEARVLVLGTEELMHAPLRVAEHLAHVLGPRGTRVRFSSTTRSPVLAVDAPDYAIRTRLVLPSHDEPADAPAGAGAAGADAAVPRFAYNVAPGDDPDRRFTDVVVVVDSVGDTAALRSPGGVLDRIGAHTDTVHLVVLPSYRPVRTATAAPDPQEPTP